MVECKELFLDAEFTNLDLRGALISLAIVGEGGDFFYAEFTDFEKENLTNWHREHVFPSLFLRKGRMEKAPEGGTYCLGTEKEVVLALKAWLAQWEAVVFWGDVPAYDWVLFCDLFGGALKLSEHVHYIVRDLATFFEIEGYDVDISRFDFVSDACKEQAPFTLKRHNALSDAWIGLQCLKKLREGVREP